jgi:hypothetical protein
VFSRIVSGGLKNRILVNVMVILFFFFLLPFTVQADSADPVYSAKSAGKLNFNDDITQEEYQNLLEGTGALNRPSSTGFGDARIRYRNVAGTQNAYSSKGSIPIQNQTKQIPPSTRTGLTFGQIAKDIKKAPSQESSDFPLTFKELSKRLKTSTSNAVIRAR